MRQLVMILVLLAMLMTAGGAVAGELPPGQLVYGGWGSSPDEALPAVMVKTGELFTVELRSAGGTGYQWQLRPSDNAPAVLLGSDSEAVNPLPMAGGEVRTRFYFKAQQAGSALLEFRLIRNWRPDEAARIFKLAAEVE